MVRVMLVLVVAAVLVLLVLTLVVQTESAYRLRPLGGTGDVRALVLVHPSRDSGFSDELAQAVARGLIEAGLRVNLATLTDATPARPQGYALVVVVSNTCWWAPDRPTRRYLARARWNGLRTIGLLAGAGATQRSQRLLERALNATGAGVVAVEPFWIWRPHDAQRTDQPSRAVAADRARRLGLACAAAVLSPQAAPPLAERKQPARPVPDLGGAAPQH